MPWCVAAAAVRAASWRMQVTRTDAGVTVINDAYNANPASVAAALRAFQKLHLDGRRIAVLGGMRELGEHHEAEHAEIGRLVTRAGIDHLIVVGEDAHAIAANADAVPVVEVADARAALAALDDFGLQSGDGVLIKASRGVGLEVLADALIAEGVRS